jgi:alpha-N-acetylglucosamine transferase
LLLLRFAHEISHDEEGSLPFLLSFTFFSTWESIFFSIRFTPILFLFMDYFNKQQSRFSSTAPWSPTSNGGFMNSTRIRRNVLLAILCLLGLIYFLVRPSGLPRGIAISSYDLSSGSVSPKSGPLSSTKTPAHKYAYTAFYSPQTPPEKLSGEQLSDEDHYLVGIRMLIYQLLHDPITRTNTSIPFVVLVTADVPQEVRERFVKDGASVLEVGGINFDWIKPGRERWAHVMDKLHVFELVQYEKVLLLDADHVIVKPLDGIFQDPATEIVPNLGNPEYVQADEAAQPAQYLMAGNSGPGQIEHPYPAPRGERLNAGFVILHPSIDMYNHYMSVAAIEGRFPGGSPEQDLWNYVHNRKKNMPWKQVNPDWTANTPIYNDYEHGIASFHEKYWGCSRDRRLRDVLLRSRWKMEGYFDARDQLLGLDP